MLFLLFALQTFPAHALEGSLKCTAIYRALENRSTVEKKVDMPQILVFGKTVNYAADLEGQAFNLNEDTESNSYLAQITKAPEYTQGSVVRATMDKDGKFNFSQVDGTTVYRMECRKKN